VALAAATQGSYRLLLTEVTGVIVVTRRRSSVFGGSPQELEEAYRRVRRHNLRRGWWGLPLGPVWTPMDLWRNRRRHAALRRLVARG
jgi:hypothetical protein